MIIVRCKGCGKEITGQPGKSQSCGCSNMMTVGENSVTAIDLTQTVMVKSNKDTEKSNALSPQDLVFQEERRKRKVRRLDFEVR
tara:strand:- start:2119 stop:2370 length:252 start_codon:yes stop_codon:yes gene_type:complete